MEISLRNIVLHLSEHHGNSTPGASIFIDGFQGLAAYHQELLDKHYQYNRPGLDVPLYDDTALEMTVIDPFGDRLIYVERCAK